MATETLVWPSPPTLMNGNDGNQPYNMGIRFSVDAEVPCPGVQWRYVPTSISGTLPPGGSHIASLWRASDEVRLAFQEFTPVPASENQDILFDTPVTLDPAELYVAAIFTRDYVFRASGGLEIGSPSGMVQADQGKLVANSDPSVYPGGNQASWYYVSPIVDLGGDPPAEGSADLGLGLAVAATGARNSSGAAALGLGLAVAATGGRASQGAAAVGINLAVAASGSSPASGTVALTLGLDPSATGARASLGQSDVGLGLAVAASGARASAGAAALGLNLAVSATGSNGNTGRPVTPFPFTPRPGSAFPWTPRPVKSFQEVDS